MSIIDLRTAGTAAHSKGHHTGEESACNRRSPQVPTPLGGGRRSAVVSCIAIAVLAMTTICIRSSSALADSFQVLHTIYDQLGGGLTLVGSELYGVTQTGGSTANGTVFSMNLDGSNFQTRYGFTGGSDGAVPVGNLLSLGSSLYGTTVVGGTGYGTFFSMNPDGSNFQTLHAFSGRSGQGAYPEAPLALVGSTLVGTSSGDGTIGNKGTAFAMNLDGSNFQTTHWFTGSGDGAAPKAGLTLVGSRLYGTASAGGANQFGGLLNHGTVFSMNLDGSNFQALHEFAGVGDGAVPLAQVTVVGSKLYGTAAGGGDAFGEGTAFSMNLDGSSFQTLHTFTFPNGQSPLTGLTLVGSKLYGTTEGGDAFGDGMVFSMNLNGSNFQIVHAFTGQFDGQTPVGDMTLVGSTLYGMTNDNIFAINVPVPEPSTLVLAGCGLLGLGELARMRRRRSRRPSL